MQTPTKKGNKFQISTVFILNNFYAGSPSTVTRPKTAPAPSPKENKNVRYFIYILSFEIVDII